MPTHLDWPEIALRLLLTALAGTIVGLDRGEHGRPAGLRTTLLVCLAAAVSMIQSNLLLPTAGRPTDSFVTLDLMRLPLGILTGMGFIGAGAILKKDDIVMGVTTAATLWFVTVLGLCFGGGQWGLGVASLVIGIGVLRGLKRVEALLPQDRRATLSLTGAFDGVTDEEIRAEIFARGFQLVGSGVHYDRDAGRWTLVSEVRWRSRATDPPLPLLVTELFKRPGVSQVGWTPIGSPTAKPASPPAGAADRQNASP
jgi:putative Mg2+ transporter-C (MgtC) family protein